MLKLYVVSAMKDNGKRAFLGCGRSEEEALQDRGGLLRGEQFIIETTKADALWEWPSFEEEIECA